MFKNSKNLDHRFGYLPPLFAIGCAIIGYIILKLI